MRADEDLSERQRRGVLCAEVAQISAPGIWTLDGKPQPGRPKS
jgi:hypothetical protein